MVQVRTAHGLGDLINTETVRGRTSYLVKGAGFQVWVDATDAHLASEGADAGGVGSPEGLFSNTFTPDKFYNPESTLYGGGGNPEEDFIHTGADYYASDAFAHDPAMHVNEDNRTTLPYDPTPQYPVEMFTEQTIQPGENVIDPDERLSPSDSRNFNDRRPNRPYPGPEPKLFAGSTDLDSQWVPQNEDDVVRPSLEDMYGVEPSPGGSSVDEAERAYRMPKPLPPGHRGGNRVGFYDPHDQGMEYPVQHEEAGEDFDERYRNHPDSWSHQPTPADYAEWEARHPDTPHGHYMGAAEEHHLDLEPAESEWGDDPWHKDLPDGPGAFEKDAYAGDPGDWDRPTAPGPDHRDFPRQHKDPAKGMPKLGPDDQPVYPFDKVSPEGIGLQEMGEGEDPDWYSCPDCGAWHNEFRHVHERRRARPPSSDDIYQPAFKGAGRHEAPPFSDPKDLVPYYPAEDSGEWLQHHPGEEEDSDFAHRAAGIFDLEPPRNMPAKFADIVAAPETDPFVCNPVAFVTRQAAIAESAGLNPRVGEEMDLVLADRDVRTAAWRDVRDKAKRLRAEGRVQVVKSTPEAIYATVEGDSGTYDTIIVRGNVFDLGGQSVTSWHCGCDWGKWAFKRRLTYVGRFCSHAYASYMEMQSRHDEVGGGGTRQQPRRRKRAGIVEDFKEWAKDNEQPTDESSMADFLGKPLGEDEDDPNYTGEDVEKLYDYVDDNRKMSPEREFDVPYTFDPDKVYKDSGRVQADALRMTPRSLTPDLQFVPEGEDEHFVDVTEDDRKTTGPGQITTDKTAAGPEYAHGADFGPYEGDYDRDVWDKDREDKPDIEHFASVLPPFYADAEQQKVNNPTPGSPANPRPDAGQSTRDLNKLRNLIQEPLNESLGDMQSRNDKVRDLVDDLHDDGVAASNLVARRRLADTGIVDHYLDFAKGHWNGEISHNSLRDYVDKYRPTEQTIGDLLHVVDQHIASLRQGGGGFETPGGPDWMDEPFEGSGADPKDWFSSSEDYVDKHERPRFQDVTKLPEGNVLKYNDTDGPVTSPRSTSIEAYLRRQADPFSNETSSVEPQGFSNQEPGMTDLGNSEPLVQPEDSGGTVASILPPFMAAEGLGGGNDLDFSSGDVSQMSPQSGYGTNPPEAQDPLGGSGGTPQDNLGGPGDYSDTPASMMGNGFGDLSGEGYGSPQGYTQPDPSAASSMPGGYTQQSGGAGGDYVMPGNGQTTFARRSVKDSIRRRQQRMGFDESTLPPGWGTNPMPQEGGDDKDDDSGGGGMPGMPGKGGGGGAAAGEAAEGAGAAEGAAGLGEVAELAPLLALASTDDEDNSDILRQFHATAGAQAIKSGGAGGGGGREGNFSDRDIAGAASQFLMRTAGRNYSPAEQAELMDEFHPLGARNLSGLDLAGTHYVQ